MTLKEKNFLGALRDAGVRADVSEKALFAASLDHMRYSFKPFAVVKAKRECDVSRTLKTANEMRIPVTVRGAGTGCAGGCVPVEGGVVLDLSGLDFIDIDPVSRVARVGAGAVNADVDKAASEYGLFYAPDPSSNKYSTIGGNIACNAGGLRALKYGVTRDNVLALRAYLPDGRRLDCGLPLKKFSTGINLRDVFIGSEGTLGVITQAWLKLLVKPECSLACLAFFDSDADAYSGIEKLMLSPLSPAVFEFMDAETCACVSLKKPEFKMPKGSSAILVQFDGTRQNALSDCGMFVKLFGKKARMARNADESALLWDFRRVASQSMYALADCKISQDIVLPLSSIRKFFAYYKALAKKLKLHSPVFGHAGDGNYHIHFMYESADPDGRVRALKGMDLAIKKTVSLGGAVSGEHGLGFLKSHYMPYQHSPAELEIMRRIKRVFDPKNILGRGKLTADGPDTSDLTPLTDVKLPWD